MFKKTRHHQLLGELIGSGRSKVWQANVSLFAFEGAFSFQIWGEEEGLNAQQEQAVAQLFERLLQIKASATLPMVDFLIKNELASPCLPPSLAAAPETVWQHLQPNYSEIRPTGEIALGFLPLFLPEVDDVLYVKIREGQFFEVNFE